MRTLLLGLCGTDQELLHRKTQDSTELIIGHEVLGVVEDDRSATLPRGSLVVGIIRRPCVQGCAACRHGDLDQCSSGSPSERGILALDGFGSEMWCSDERYLIRVPHLLGESGVFIEPASSIAKLLRRIGDNRLSECRRAVIYGAGTMGFLAALMLQSKGILATLIDPYAGDNKRRIAETLDLKLQQTISSLEPPPDLVIELSGSPDGLVDALSHTGHNTLVTVLGIYGMPASLEPSLLNHCVFSDVQMVFSVNASRLDYETAASMLSEVGHHRLKSLVTRELSLTNWTDGLQRSGDHIKSLIRFSD